jgi:hypothetical protein
MMEKKANEAPPSRALAGLGQLKPVILKIPGD